jgi:hypothetical protein
MELDFCGIIEEFLTSMTSRSAWWLDKAIYLVSIILACIVTLFFLTPNYNGGGGAVYFVIAITALVFRLLFSFILQQWQKI